MGNYPVISELIQIFSHPSILAGKKGGEGVNKCQELSKLIQICPYCSIIINLISYVHSQHYENTPILNMMFYWLWRHIISMGKWKTNFKAILHPLQKKTQQKEGYHHLIVTISKYHFLCLIKYLDGAWNWNGKILQGRYGWMDSLDHFF